MNDWAMFGGIGMKYEDLRIDVGTEARRRARKAAPKAGAVRKIEDKRKKAPKHRKPLREE